MKVVFGLHTIKKKLKKYDLIEYLDFVYGVIERMNNDRFVLFENRKDFVDTLIAQQGGDKP